MVIGVLIAGVLTVSAVPQKPVCDMVTEADAVAVLGSVKKKSTIPGRKVVAGK